MRAAQLPAGCGSIENATDQLRVALEDAVLAAKGQVDLGDAAAISTAVRAERLAALAAKWLRDKYDSLSADARLSYARETVKASEARDRAIRSLGIDAKSIEQYQRDQLYRDLYGPRLALPPATSAPEPSQNTPDPADAPASVLCDLGGCQSTDSSIPTCEGEFQEREDQAADRPRVSAQATDDA